MSDSRGLNNYNCIVIIPTYNPDEKLIQVVEGVIGKGFKKIIIVNDGSSKDCEEPLKYVENKKECILLKHKVNQGKGRALKTAFEYVLQKEKDVDAVVTVDGDNQHKPEDILNCVECASNNRDALVAGCRDFSGKDLPLRSKFGNNLTRFIFKTACGVKISDTQTGLRVIPAKYLEAMLETQGERYEYETNMFLSLKKYGIPYKEQKIETVYIEDNKSSHFNPIIDSLKIYKVIFGYVFSSLTAAGIDLFSFTLLLFGFNFVFESKLSILLATVLARIISSLINCICNKVIVFKSGNSMRTVLIRYYTLCVCQTTISYLGVAGLAKILGIGKYAIMVTIVKMMVDTVLFFLSYHIQKSWVYKEDDKKRFS